MLNILWLIFLSLFLFACASKPPSSGDEQLAMIDNKAITEPGIEPGIILPKPKEKAYVHNAAIKRLINRAKKMTEQERYDSAIQELERGLAIAPNNPHIWQNLAMVRLFQGRYLQAEQLANKSNALSQGDSNLKSINRQIIISAREEAGTN